MDNIQFIIKDYQRDKLGIGNVLKCLISALSVNDDTVIECYDDYIYGNFQTVLDDKFIFKGKSHKELEKVYSCRLLIHKNEEDIQEDIPNEEWYLGGLDNPRFHHLFSFSKRIDWNYDPNKINPLVKQRIFNAIDKISFKPEIVENVDSVYNHFKDTKSLGISIRTWRASHEININRPYNFDTYKQKILEVLQKYPDINFLLISIDNHSLLENYNKLFKELGIKYVILNKSDKVNDIQYAAFKALILAKCNYFIGNRISTFSELVFWFSKHQTEIYTVF